MYPAKWNRVLQQMYSVRFSFSLLQFQIPRWNVYNYDLNFRSLKNNVFDRFVALLDYICYWQHCSIICSNNCLYTLAMCRYCFFLFQTSKKNIVQIEISSVSFLCLLYCFNWIYGPLFFGVKFNSTIFFLIYLHLLHVCCMWKVEEKSCTKTHKFRRVCPQHFSFVCSSVLTQ